MIAKGASALLYDLLCGTRFGFVVRGMGVMACGRSFCGGMSDAMG